MMQPGRAVLTVLAIAFLVAPVQSVTPVESVVKLLKKLQKQTMQEGQIEAKAYDKFACFCKEQADEKHYSIKTKSEKNALLTAEIKTLEAEITKATQDSFTSTKQAESLKKTAEAEQGERDKAKAAHVIDRKDLADSVQECKDAVQLIKATTVPSQSLVQKAVSKALAATSRTNAIATASPSTLKHIQSLVDRHYGEQHSAVMDMSDIVQVIMDMEKMIKKMLDDKDAHESEINHEFNLAQAARMRQIKSLEDAVAEFNKQVSVKQDELQLATEDFQKTTTDQNADEAFLDDLTSTCEAKATAWDERSKTRSEEITSITSALTALQEEVAPKDKEKKLSALALGAPKVSRHSKAGHWEWVADKDAESNAEAKDSSSDTEIADDSSDSDAENADASSDTDAELAHASTNDFSDTESDEESDAEEDGDTEDASADKPEDAISLVQRGKGQHSALRGGAKHFRGTTHKMFAYLQSQAKKLKSSNLAMLAVRMQEDHFVKVRGMIKDMVTKLEEDASDEADQKQWCDEEMGKATTKRDENVGAVETDTARMTENTAQIEQKDEEVGTLIKEIAALEKGLNEATELRTTEHHENEQAEADATAGLAGVEKAINILKAFYENALLQTGAAYTPPGADASGKTVGDLAPKTASGTYAGNQGAASGIMGQLSVIKSDFERTIQDTQDAEDTSDSEYTSLKSDTESEVSEKKTLLASTKRDITQHTGVVDDAKGDLKDHYTLKAEALQELAELKPACVSTGGDYIERVRQREAEIESLKNALVILQEMR